MKRKTRIAGIAFVVLFGALSVLVAVRIATYSPFRQIVVVQAESPVSDSTSTRTESSMEPDVSQPSAKPVAKMEIGLASKEGINRDLDRYVNKNTRQLDALIYVQNVIAKTAEMAEPYTTAYAKAFDGIQTVLIHVKRTQFRDFAEFEKGQEYDVTYYITLKPYRVREETTGASFRQLKITTENAQYIEVEKKGVKETGLRPVDAFHPATHTGIPSFEILNYWKKYGAGFEATRSGDSPPYGMFPVLSSVGKCDLVFDGRSGLDNGRMLVQGFTYWAELSGLPECYRDQIAAAQVVKVGGKDRFLPKIVEQYRMTDNWQPGKDVVAKLVYQDVKINISMDESSFRIPERRN